MGTEGIDWKNLNKIRSHNRNETMKHLIAKSMAAKIMIDAKYMVYTEHEITRNKKTRVADVYGFKGKDRIIVEIESVPTKKHNKELVDFYADEGDLIIVDLRRISMDIHEMEKQLREMIPI